MEEDKFVFGTFQVNDASVLEQVIQKCFEYGVRTIDTAPSYKTESLLGSIFQNLGVNKGNARKQIRIQTKIDGWQMQASKGNVFKYVKEALQKMRLDYIDTVLIHWPFPDYLSETWQCLSDIKAKGVIRKIGLCNVRKRHIIQLVGETSIKPDVIQIERHPLRNANHDIVFFHEQCINVQAYSPLCRMDARVKESTLLQQIADSHHTSLAQIIMRWHYQSGVTPVFTTKKADRIINNTAIFDFSLSQEEMTIINNMDINYKLFVESICCPGF